MLKFDFEKAKKLLDYDSEQYNEECFLNTLKDYLGYFTSHNKNLTRKQYRFIHDCLALINCIDLVDKKEN